MWGRKKRNNKKKDTHQYSNDELPKRDVSIHEVRQAIQRFTSHLPNGVELQTIINEDNTINYELLSPYLDATPNETYYMSKETYEVFDEKDKQLAFDLDHIQQAIDRYMKQTNELPIIDGDPYNKVNYFKLERLGLISYRPEFTFYITDEEYLITYEAPSSKKG
ncbi:DUF3939 domain-containing protein [Pontibacillus yanchengensis]|uniref:DUF3939 domain-containing protein n=2 Tax=Pontibacillus yanchengensis TaxID=462910 RepID=A0ACC7VD43_9BACI|nr:DUF3939 domain-containing protein [Pontibacillus yanchengensis]MYL32321.1 DUF3939 domain-containing protein [Pontibacillus yanchengensis]MYL52901.1 DUF3939 domain-containing protein [Pontibacillus yanchengensis]